MRIILAGLLLAAAAAFAQSPPARPAAPDKALAPQARCGDCGVVRTVRAVKKELASTPAADSKPSGLVASVPLGGGRPKVGSSTNLGKDTVTTIESWEVTVQMDNGSFRLVRATEEPGVREGDKVRVDDKGRVKLRTD
jgi:hypothetical protein